MMLPIVNLHLPLFRLLPWAGHSW